MLRWFVIPRNKLFNIYLHDFKRSDDPRALHDHPWLNLSVLLEGEYTEVTIADGGVHYWRVLKAGETRMRLPTSAHRIELHPGVRTRTLFLTGPLVRKWGFHCRLGWKPYDEFVRVTKDETGQKVSAIGEGCGELE